MQEWILETMNQFGYLGIALLIALENVFPPIPSEVVLTFGGFLTTTTELTPVGMVLASTVGSLIGAVILYGLGRCMSAKRLERLMNTKLCRALGFKMDDIHSSAGWFGRHGKAAVFFGRFVPIVRSLISIPAGMARMQLPLFLLLTTLGSVVWNTALVLLGVVAGASWEKIVDYFGIYSALTVAVLGVAFVVLAFLFLRKRLKKRQEEITQEKNLEVDE